MKLLRLLIIGLGLLLGGKAVAEVMPPSPARYFNDYAGKVSPSVAEALDRQLRQFEQETTCQVVVAVFPKMESEATLEDYVRRLFQHWQIGQKEKNNGVLLAVFVQDRKLRIEVGTGLEGMIPNDAAQQIITDKITPSFKAGNFDVGLVAGVNAILRKAQGQPEGKIGEPQPRLQKEQLLKLREENQKTPQKGWFPWRALLLVLGLIVACSLPSGLLALLFLWLARQQGMVITSRGSDWDRSHSSSSWSSSSSSSGSGGFSGGGGSSRGGGAIGSW